ncbi:hypothetical protein IIS_06007 [Bacillus cereus VD131]|nr:hypothetical protein IIS_06007 [Bacillus cereus VD131]
MTLIIGVVLPKGILLVSDTRSTDEITGEIISDFNKKILSITPSVNLAGSGSESNWYASKILRNCLYNTIFSTPSRYSNLEVRSKILNLYNQVNNLHQTNHPNGDPMGQVLVAEFDKSTSTFNLLHQCGTEGFTTFNVMNNVHDVAVIGSTIEIRNKVKTEVRLALSSLPHSIINHNGGYIAVVDLCHKIIKKQKDKGIGKNIYCSYLTQKDGMPQNSRLLVKEDGEDYYFETDDGLKEIKY